MFLSFHTMEEAPKKTNPIVNFFKNDFSWKEFSVFFLIACTMLFYGMTAGASGITLPLIKDHFKNNYDLQGFILAISGYGYALFSFCTSLLLRKIGVRWVLTIGVCIIILTGIGMIYLDNFYLVCTMIFFISFANSNFDVGGNCTGTLIARKHSGIIMHLIHFFYGLGSTLGPLFASWMIRITSGSYQSSYMGFSILGVVVLIYVVFVPLDNTSVEDGQKSKYSVCDALKSKYVWLFSFLLSFFYIIELGPSTWGVLYLHDKYGIDPDGLGTTWLSLYFGLYTLSRLFSGFIVDKVGHFRSLSLVLTCYIVGFLIDYPGIWVIASTGYPIAIVFPTLMCIGVDVYKRDVSNAMSITMTLAGLLNATWNQVIGIINEHIDNIWGYRMIVPLCAMIIILLIIIYCCFKKEFMTEQNKEVVATENDTTALLVEPSA